MGAGSTKPKDEPTREGHPQNTTQVSSTNTLTNPQTVLEPAARETSQSKEKKLKQNSVQEDIDIVESELLELENDGDVLELGKEETLNEHGVDRTHKTAKKKKKSSKDGSKPAAWKMSKSHVEKQIDVNRVSNDGRTMEKFQHDLLEYELEGEDMNSTVLTTGNDDIYTTKQTKEQNQGSEVEKFDPSKVIDVNKFKAANAPQNKANVPQKLSGHSTYEGSINDENVLGNEDTNKNIINTSGQDRRISSNKKVIYNEEEELLMASIEKEFLSDLPGSVLSV